MINKIKNKLGFDNCTKKQLLYITIIPLLIGLLGVISKDSPLNILIGVSGAFYVAYYAIFSTKYSFSKNFAEHPVPARLNLYRLSRLTLPPALW